MENRRKILKQLCREFLDAALNRLELEGEWPVPHGLRFSLNAYDLSFAHWNEFPELERLIEYFVNDPELARLYSTKTVAEPREFVHLARRLLVLTVRDSRGDLVENSVFNYWFTRFERELFAKSSRWRIFNTVTGVKVVGAPLALNRATKLTSHPGYRLEELADGQRIEFRALGPGGFDNATIISDFTIDKSDYAGSFDGAPYFHQIPDRSDAYHVVESIRLLMGGTPRLHCHARVNRSKFPMSEPFGYTDDDGMSQIHDEEILVQPKDHRKIRGLALFLRDTNSQKGLARDKLNIALSRFDGTFGREKYWGDTFLDLGIALESLFAPRDSRELSYRVSSRAAWLLGTDDDSSASIYRQVRTIYSLRSAIAHGSRQDDSDLKKELKKITDTGLQTWDNLNNFADPAIRTSQELVRRAILACINVRRHSGQDDGINWPFPDEFDNHVWSTVTRRAWQKAAGVR